MSKSLRNIAKRGRTNEYFLSTKYAAPKRDIAPIGAKLRGWGINREIAATIISPDRMINRLFIEFSNFPKIKKAPPQ